jgi:hypothetical protein
MLVIIVFPIITGVDNHHRVIGVEHRAAWLVGALGVENLLIDECLEERSNPSFLNLGTLDVVELPIKESNSEELRPLSGSEDDQETSNDGEIVELLHHIGVGVELVRILVEGGNDSVDYELV